MSRREPGQRMFAAVVPPDDVIAHLDEFLRPRREAAEFRWTVAEHMHVTLAFLPTVPDRKLDDLVERLARAGRRRTAFETRIAGGGAFPNPARSKVLYAGLELSDAARTEFARMATGARAAAARAGLEVEGQRFRPHVTVARINRPTDTSNWVRLLDSYAGPAFAVDRITLLASYLGEGPRNRPRYEVVEEFPLSRPDGDPCTRGRPRCPKLRRVRIAVARETREGETRVAVVPELVDKLTGLGAEVLVEPEAGRGAQISDEEFTQAGASIDAGALEHADVVVSVRPLAPEAVRRLRRGTATISFLPVGQEHELVAVLRDAGVTSFSMELVPRISRAQAMDALSSQALVAGYRSVIVAAGMLRRFFPLNMTAAGTVHPAEVVVLGAGVAGLQAIATAKRLGAVVRAYDVRAAAAEEIRSMGAKAIELDLETLEGTGGYAREMTEDRAARQRELLAPYIADADALITTAAVPGRQAPMLVTREMVEQMKPGSVVVDLAAESGGNVEGSEAGEVVRIGHAQVWGGRNVPAQMPGPASKLYAQNILNIVSLMTVKGEEGGPASFAPDFDDEVVAGACVTDDGAIRHEPTREAIEGPAPEPQPAPDPDPGGAPYDQEQDDQELEGGR